MNTSLPALVPLSAAGGFTLPSVLTDLGLLEMPSNDVLGANVWTGFAVVSVRGKVWRAKYQGEETIIRDTDGEPRRKLQVIILLAPANVSRTYYKGAYVPGATEAPDCFSNDGITPDLGVADPQASNCAACPMSQFGSKITDTGSKSKACQEHKRLAIVPADDIENAALGGPMMLRVPPTSLQELAKMQATLKKYGNLPYYAVVTDIGFNPEVEYPQLMFTPRAVIQSNEVMRAILDQRDSTVAENIVFGQSTVVDVLPVAKNVHVRAQAAQAAAAPVEAKATPAKRRPKAEPEVEAAAAATTTAAIDDADDDNAELLAAMTKAKSATTETVKAEPAEVKVVDKGTDAKLGSLLAGLL
jgi:hypothetical protein